MELTLEQARRVRLRSQGLGAQRADGVLEAVRNCGAVQAQDRMGEALAVRARSNALVLADLEQARSEARSVARTWLMRGTLHLTAADDLRWMLAVLGEAMDRKALRRRADLGITPDAYRAAMTLLRRELAGGKALSRAEITEHMRAAGLPWEGQTVPHLLRAASLNGLICFGPAAGSVTTHVLLDDWLSDPGADAAALENPAAELARRYLRAYGPAAPADFRWWSGLPAADARAGFSALSAELTEVSVEGRAMWILSERADAVKAALAAAAPLVRVLGAFDPYLLGYAKRELGVPDALLRRVHPGGGMILPTVLVDGVLAATWRRRRGAGGILLLVSAFQELPDEVRAGIDAEVSEIGRFLGAKTDWELTIE